MASSSAPGSKLAELEKKLQGLEDQKAAELKKDKEARDKELLSELNKDLDRVQAAVTALSSGNSGKRKQERQNSFKRELYNYYTDKAARILPTTIQCMITRLHLQAADVVAAHLWPKGRDMETAFMLNIPDVWHVRNGMLWAAPFEQAWNRKEVALFWNTQTSSLIVRVLTQELMSTLLMHYKTSDADKGTYGFKPFGEFDKAEVLHVRKDAMPYRRALLYHAAVAVAFQRSRGMLRDDIAFHADDFDVVSDFEKKPDVERRLNLINSSTSLALRALVFDEMCAASFKKQRFLRMYNEIHNTSANIAETTLPGNPYLGMWPALSAQISAMHQLCALLEIESSQDLTSQIPKVRTSSQQSAEERDKAGTSSQQSAEERDTAGNDLKTAIGQVLTAFSNTKLSTIRRGQARKPRGVVDNPVYGTTINTVKVENTKLRDPFTEAVIELIKPQACLEFLPDT
ncbi:hypothetical protein WJX79_009500 [Trebouxia sp. C0005]